MSDALESALFGNRRRMPLDRRKKDVAWASQLDVLNITNIGERLYSDLLYARRVHWAKHSTVRPNRL